MRGLESRGPKDTVAIRLFVFVFYGSLVGLFVNLFALKKEQEKTGIADDPITREDC